MTSPTAAKALYAECSPCSPQHCSTTLFLIALVICASFAVSVQAFSVPANYSPLHSANNSYPPTVSAVKYTDPGTNRTYGLGLLPEKVQPSARVTLASATPLPQHFDWRNKDGYNWVGPIKDQGECGSCVAFAVVGATEMQYRIAYNNPTWNLDLSEQHLFSCGGGNCVVGWTFSEALYYLKTRGTPDESCLPYRGGDASDSSCSATCPDWQSRAYKIDDYLWTTGGASVIETALMSGPVLAAFEVYQDFFSYTGGVYHHTWGIDVGGHAVLIVGYDIPGQYWIVKNSWGSGWGDHGYVNIGFGEGNIGSYTVSVIVRTPIPSSTVTATATLTESSVSYLSRTATTTSTSYTSTSTSTSTIPTTTTVALLPVTRTEVVHSTQYLTSRVTTALTSYTGTDTSTSTILVFTTVTASPATSSSTARTTQVFTLTGTATETRYTTATTTSYIDTTTSTSTSVVYTTVTKSGIGGGSSSSADLGVVSLLVIAFGGVTISRGRRTPKTGSGTGRRCSDE